MTRRMTKEEALARRKAVEQGEREDYRKQTPHEKFRVLALLMASPDRVDTAEREAEDAMARARWARLQSLYLDRR